MPRGPWFTLLLRPVYHQGLVRNRERCGSVVRGQTPPAVATARSELSHKSVRPTQPWRAGTVAASTNWRAKMSDPHTSQTFHCPRISGSPFFEFPTTTTLVFGLLAKVSVASIPFHSSNDGVIPWATICWKSRTPCASLGHHFPLASVERVGGVRRGRFADRCTQIGLNQ